MSSAVYNRRLSGYRVDPSLGEIYQDMPERADDLTEIRGIDTREAVVLNRMGVYFFDQIAGWKDRQVAAFASEMGMSESSLFEQRWVPQAQMLMNRASGEYSVVSPMRPTSAPPASVARTLTLFVCALMIGCFVVYALNRNTSLPIVGVLAADTTSLRVPTDARLVTSRIVAGDEVFTGEILLTLEKTVHLEQIAVQERTVARLQKELDDAETRSAVELKWRTQALETELTEIRTRAELLRQIGDREERLSTLDDEMFPDDGVLSDDVTEDSVQTVSSGREMSSARSRVNTLLFISGRTDLSTFETVKADTPTFSELKSVPQDDVQNTLLQAEVDGLRRRGQRLEQLKKELPDQVRAVAGVSRLAVQLVTAEDILSNMRRVSRQVDVLCPSYGTVSQVNFRVGDQMERGEELAKILHTNRRFVIVRAPTRRLHELQPGSEVRLAFPGHDDCAGIVQDVPMLAEGESSSGESHVSVRVEATGRYWPELPIGSQVDVFLR